MSCCSFADLPGDVVSIVADRADVECRPRMRAVCSAWRAAVPFEPQPPWILVHPDDTASPEGERRSGFSVLSLPAGVNLRPDSSVVGCINNKFPAGSRCVGAGHGWLALVGTDDLSVTLVNPVTGCAVSLPPLTRHPMVGGLRDKGRVLWRRWIDAWPDAGDLVPVEEFVVDTFVRKLVFSASPEQDDYFAVLIGDHLPFVTYARAGATAWKTLRDDVLGKPVSLVHDVVHVEGGRFLAVKRRHGQVLEIDLAVQDGGGDHEHAQNDVMNNGDDDDVHNRRHSPRVRTFAFAENIACFTQGTNMHAENHLVLINGDVYQIWVSWVLEEEADSDEEIDRYRIADAGVVRYDPEQSTCWSVVAGLGDWAVLVGRSETVAVRAGDMPWVKGSCLYFIDDRLQEQGLCAFDLRSSCQVPVETACSIARSKFGTPLPVWFLPSAKTTARYLTNLDDCVLRLEIQWFKSLWCWLIWVFNHWISGRKM